MGQKHSKRPKKLKSQPEVTEIIELNDNQSEPDDECGGIVSDVIKPSVYPIELKKVMENVESIEKSIESMTASQINLYYANLKDDLHGNWQKVYEIKDGDDVRAKKIETIERIKSALKRLNEEVLTRNDE
ncbi:hypothetical protein BDFB_003927 [Asbolus verrucosus]|uniref:Uncharacterized protein n=1 Tax=Asbolus verrucosus TaxID=1661398 RepID=A0A482W1J6_ASBVE|nr:hypothetical protein BDFB_003927 [Asbolus verrucosus]